VHPDEGPLPIDLYALGRGLTLWAVVALVGVSVFVALIPRWRLAEDDEHALAARALARAWQVARTAALVLLGADLLRAYGQVRSFLDPTEAFTWDVARAMLLETAWGRGWLCQLSVAALTLAAILATRRRPAIGLAVVSTSALALAAVTPLTGHAIENPWGSSLGVGLHAVHLVGAGVWIGTLFTMLVAGLRTARSTMSGDDAAVARMVAAFSPIALTGAALAIGAGSLMGYAYIGDLASLLTGRYGTALLIKLGLLGVTLALGAWNWKRVTPTLGQARATAALARSATIEVLIALLVLAVTAVLVALPAPKV
jgi:putative copper export protein